MEHQTARGFLRLCVNSEAWKKLIQDYENSLMPGRYLAPFEILRRLRMSDIGQKHEAEITAMQELWGYFSRQLWKEQQIEEKNHDTTCGPAALVITGEKKAAWCRCRTPQQELHAWDDFVVREYQAPMPPPSEKTMEYA